MKRALLQVGFAIALRCATPFLATSIYLSRLIDLEVGIFLLPQTLIQYGSSTVLYEYRCVVKGGSASKASRPPTAVGLLPGR